MEAIYMYMYCILVSSEISHIHNKNNVPYPNCLLSWCWTVPRSLNMILISSKELYCSILWQQIGLIQRLVLVVYVTIVICLKIIKDCKISFDTVYNEILWERFIFKFPQNNLQLQVMSCQTAVCELFQEATMHCVCNSHWVALHKLIILH
jgi:hypothetical protein